MRSASEWALRSFLLPTPETAAEKTRDWFLHGERSEARLKWLAEMWYEPLPSGYNIDRSKHDWWATRARMNVL